MISDFTTFLRANNLRNQKLLILPNRAKQEIVEYNLKEYSDYLCENITMNIASDKDLNEYRDALVSVISYISKNISDNLLKINVTEHFLQYLGQGLTKGTEYISEDNIDQLSNYHMCWHLTILVLDKIAEYEVIEYRSTWNFYRERFTEMETLAEEMMWKYAEIDPDSKNANHDIKLNENPVEESDKSVSRNHEERIILEEEESKERESQKKREKLNYRDISYAPKRNHTHEKIDSNNSENVLINVEEEYDEKPYDPNFNNDQNKFGSGLLFSLTIIVIFLLFIFRFTKM
jgi:hypothetical protein